jgi:ATP-dependent helicase/nuclease subunit A
MNQITESGAFRISASAGSGKTYSLTRLFIQRVLKSPNAYAGIVAITFTNKAANELKERIVSRLKELTIPDRKHEDQDLFGFADRHQLARQAKQTLLRILHDFDNLKVTTIDSFFQTIFSNLAYEANFPPGLKSEVDLTLIKKEVLKEGIRSMSELERKVMVQNLTDQMVDSGKDWRVVANIRNNLIENLFEEKVIRFQMNAGEKELQDEMIINGRKKLQSYYQNIEEEIQRSAKGVLSFLDSIGFSTSDLDPEKDSQYFSEYGNIQRAASGIELPKSTPKTHKEGKLYRPPKSRLLTNYQMENLAPFLIRYGEAKNDQNLANHSLAKALAKNLPSIRLLVFFRSILQRQNKRNNRVILGEIKFILNKIIGNSEVPFLFERLGTQIHTILIDEFQDTDKIQWNVLLPLCKHVVESDGLLAVVGDVKQSIYGWRGADSTLFKEGIEKTMAPISVAEHRLNTNFRSEACIVEFNNWAFKVLSDSFAENLLVGEQVVSDAGWAYRVRRNYEDVQQEVNPEAKKRSAGFVELRVRRPKKAVDNEESEDPSNQTEEAETSSMPWLIEEIKKLQDVGFKASEIAVLVRKNSAVLEVVEILDTERQKMEPGYDFSFSTSLMGKAGDLPLYRFLILAMQNSTETDPDRFIFEEMEQIARTLKIDPQFYPTVFPAVPDWRLNWRVTNEEPSGSLMSLFFKQVSFFGLEKVVNCHNDLLEFQNLLYQYIQQDSILFPDFFEWWNDKASEKDRLTSEKLEGIKVMTIHKSKGLDFGVVIVPMVSNTKSDSVHGQSVFWPESEKEPWNAFPLLKADAKITFLKSDLAESYQEDVYRRSLENLNNLYVAFTRPRHGLIIDLSVDFSLEKEDKKSKPKNHRLGFNLPFSLKNAFENGVLPFENCRLIDPKDDIVFHFSFGNYEKRRLPEKSEINKNSVIFSPVFQGTNSIPWAIQQEQSFEVSTGILVHRILEMTVSKEKWKDLLREEIKQKKVVSEIALEAERQLNHLFSFPEFQEWFSGKYVFYPEQQMVAANGEILRADRLLIHSDKMILLDFKTGEVLSKHISQIREYSNALQSATKKNVDAFLVYSAQKKIISIGQ